MFGRLLDRRDDMWVKGMWKYEHVITVSSLFIFVFVLQFCGPDYLRAWNCRLTATGAKNLFVILGLILLRPGSWPLCVWLRQTSKFQHNASFARKIFCICTLCAWIFFSNLPPQGFFYAKLHNLTISKQGLVVKFAHLT